jgi:hypothetical protein
LCLSPFSLCSEFSLRTTTYALRSGSPPINLQPIGSPPSRSVLVSPPDRYLMGWRPLPRRPTRRQTSRRPFWGRGAGSLCYRASTPHKGTPNKEGGVSVLDRQTYQGVPEVVGCAMEDRDRETWNSKVRQGHRTQDLYRFEPLE